MTNPQRPSRQMELAGILCVVLGLLAVVFDTGAVMRILGVLLTALGASVLILKARQIRERQQAEGLADLRAEQEPGVRPASAAAEDREEAPIPAGGGVQPQHATPPPPPVDRDLAAAAGRTLAVLIAHRALRPLDETEIAMVGAAVSDAGNADLATVLAAIGETAGLADGDPVRLTEQSEEVRDLLARAASRAGADRRLAAYTVEDTWVVGLHDDDAALAAFNADLALPDRHGAAFRWLDDARPQRLP